MSKLKITIDHIKNYLGTGLKSITLFQGEKLIRNVTEHNFTNYIDESTSGKLLFYRLSDLDKFIPELGFVPLIELAKMDSSLKNVEFEINEFGNCIGRLNSGVTVVFEIQDELPFIKAIHNNIFDQVSGNNYDDMCMASFNPSELREKLFQWHFWPFDQEYFDQGLVLDKLTYGKEVVNE